jgi:hypothetical protein
MPAETLCEQALDSMGGEKKRSMDDQTMSRIERTYKRPHYVQRKRALYLLRCITQCSLQGGPHWPSWGWRQGGECHCGVMVCGVPAAGDQMKPVTGWKRDAVSGRYTRCGISLAHILWRVHSRRTLILLRAAAALPKPVRSR